MNSLLIVSTIVCFSGYLTPILIKYVSLDDFPWRNVNFALKQKTVNYEFDRKLSLWKSSQFSIHSRTKIDEKKKQTKQKMQTSNFFLQILAATYSNKKSTDQTLRSEMKNLEIEMSRISVVNEFARFTRLQRRHAKMKDELRDNGQFYCRLIFVFSIIISSPPSQ